MIIMIPESRKEKCDVYFCDRPGQLFAYACMSIGDLACQMEVPPLPGSVSGPEYGNCLGMELEALRRLLREETYYKFERIEKPGFVNRNAQLGRMHPKREYYLN